MHLPLQIPQFLQSSEWTLFPDHPKIGLMHRYVHTFMGSPPIPMHVEIPNPLNVVCAAACKSMCQNVTPLRLPLYGYAQA